MANNAKRSSLRGLEGAIFDLLCTEAATEQQWAEWLRVPLQHAAAVGDLRLVIELQRAGANGSALHEALKGGQPALVRDLVKLGASVHAIDENGNTPLHLAAALGDEKTVSLLLEKWALLNALDSAGRAPLHVAVDKGHISAVNVLLAAGADTSFRYGEDKDSALDLAAAKGHVQIVTALIRSGANVNAADSTGSTALHEAAYHNEVGVIDVLMDGRAMVEAEDEDGWTALHFAADQGSSEAVFALLGHGADSNKVALANHGRTPLHLVAKDGSVASLNALLAAGADASLRAGAHNALDFAVIYGHVDVARALITHGVDVNDADTTGRTALHAAAASNKASAIEVLLEAGAEADAHGYGWTPLHAASKKGCSEAIVTLMRHGACKNKVDRQGRSPLYLAVENGRVDATNALLNASADVDIIPGVDGTSLLSLAASDGHIAVLRALIQNGADVNGVDVDGSTALHEAATSNKVGAIDVLVEAGANVNAAEDTCTWTPLHCASHGFSFHAVLALLKNRARVDERDSDGRSPLHLAAARGNLTSTKAILAAGADATATDNRGCTALHEVAQHGHQDVLRVLVQAGADVNATNYCGRTALHGTSILPLFIVDTRMADVVRVLVEIGATVDARDQSGRTTLLLCVSKMGCLDTMAALLECGANANAQDLSGNFLLHLATSIRGRSLEGAENVVELLLRWGADETAANGSGETPLGVAAANFGVGNLGRLPDLLTQAPVERTWRRRAWLLLYRAYPRRMRRFPGTTGVAPSDRAKKFRARSVSTEEVAGIAISAVRGGGAGGVAPGGGSSPVGDWNGVVTWVVGLGLEGVFRSIVKYL